jgi:sigma-B regulation protein RsbU (phosphoserine phosphatase)
MLPEERFSELLRDLQSLERPLARGETLPQVQGGAILEAFLRHTDHDAGVVFLRDGREGALSLAARKGAFEAPEVCEGTLPDDVLHRGSHRDQYESLPLTLQLDSACQTLVPLRTGREQHGFVALSRTRLSPLPPCEIEILRACSRYVAAVIQSQRLTTEMREGDFQLKYRLWELESLYDIGLSIASTLDLDKLADEILARTISLLNARRAALYLRQGDRFALHRSFGDVRSEFLDDELERSLAHQLLEEGRPLRFDSSADCVFPRCESFVALPIRSGDEVIGVLAAADRELRDGGVGAFEENDLRVLSLFANQVAIALENARLHREALAKQAMDREMELAATIQRDILPRSLPQVEGFEIDAFSRPASQLGGDYHAFFSREGTLSMCVADVAGKSVPAALLVSAFHAALQLLFAEGRDLGDIATELNRHIHLWSAENKFITLFLATIDPEREIVQYVNAGHNPGYVASNGKLHHLASHGLPVGLMPGTRYKTQTRQYPLGGTLLAYSDGITEAENAADEEFGNSRLEELLQLYGTESCAAIRNAIASAVDHFASGTAQKDDQTIVLVRTLPRVG